MGQRRERPENPAISHENVEPAETVEQGRAEPVERVEVGEVARDQRRLAAHRADLVVEFVERALRAGERDDMGPPAREGERHGAANPARGSGDERDAGGGEVMRSRNPGSHAFSSSPQLASASSDSCARFSAARSVRAVG